MASFTITIPNDKVNDVVDAFASIYNRPETVLDVDGETEIPNPQTKANFAKAQIRNYLREIYKKYKQAEYVVAVETVTTDADTYTDDLDVT